MPLASHSTATIAQALSGIDFPANKNDLIEHARRNNADKDVIQTLNEMPDEQYTSMADVFKGVGQSH
ncbi:MAG TPA: DUF2795 domain-containing protein [Rhodospirillaceae bacterium]|nr:DUF2795 domain-containing protein [Rhodospirillaceae bacterium]